MLKNLYRTSSRSSRVVRGDMEPSNVHPHRPEVIVHHLNTPTVKVSGTVRFIVIHHLCPDNSKRYFVIISVPIVGIFDPLVCPVDNLHPSGLSSSFFLPGMVICRCNDQHKGIRVTQCESLSHLFFPLP